MIMYDAEHLNLVGPKGRIILCTGFIGAFITFSTFAYETFRLLEDGKNVSFSLNIILNVLLCLMEVSIAYLAPRF